jgi:5-methylcytosine-specific restriction endonuclease McrA
MTQFYDVAKLRTKATGVTWEVDHVIPLRGKSVSGLHVPTNLQVILKSENRAKRNFVSANLA